MSTPSPADLIRRRPAGAAGSRGGQFRERRNDAPTVNLASVVTDPGVLPASLAEDVPEYVVIGAELLREEYRSLWKRLNAEHLGSVYGDAARLSVTSSDPAELAVLGQFQGDGVSLNVARNPATPAAVLHVGESDFRDPAVRMAAISHPNCAEETLRIAWAHRRTADFQGIGAPAIGSAPNTPADIRADIHGDSAVL